MISHGGRENRGGGRFGSFHPVSVYDDTSGSSAEECAEQNGDNDRNKGRIK